MDATLFPMPPTSGPLRRQAERTIRVARKTHCVTCGGDAEGGSVTYTHDPRTGAELHPLVTVAVCLSCLRDKPLRSHYANR